MSTHVVSARCAFSVSNTVLPQLATGVATSATTNQTFFGVTIPAATAAIAGVPVGSTVSLSITNIGPLDLAALTRLVRDHLPKLAHLELRFAPVNHAGADHGSYLHSLAALWAAFGQAPQLRSLALLAGQEIVYQLPFSFLDETPPPHLSRIHIEGFQLEEPCPAFTGVGYVRVDLAVIAGVDAPSLGELFSSAQAIHIAGLESIMTPSLDEQGNQTMAPLTYLHHVPPVTSARPIPRLHLEWATRGTHSPSPSAAKWIEDSAHFVGALVVACPDHEDVRLATLHAVSAQATTLSVQSAGMAGHSALGFSARPAPRSAHVIVHDASIGANFSLLRTADLELNLPTLSIATSRLHTIANMPVPNIDLCWGLQNLEIVVDSLAANGTFFSPILLPALPRLLTIQSLRIITLGQASTAAQVDASAVLALRAALAPNALLI